MQIRMPCPFANELDTPFISHVEMNEADRPKIEEFAILLEQVTENA